MDLWRRLFKLFGLNTGLLANANTYEDAIRDFGTRTLEIINDLVEQAEDFKSPLPLTTAEAAAAIETHCKSLGIAQRTIEHYLHLHKCHQLDKDADNRKKALVNGSNLKRLNKLTHVKALGSGKLEGIQRQIGVLVSCNGCSNDDLLKNARSLCPKCSFNPLGRQADVSALDALVQCETESENLLAN